MPQQYIKRKTKPVATYGETGEENKIQWITKSVGTFTGGGGEAATVDTEMSDTSTNAVQNKVIKEYVDTADENLTKVMPTDINVDSNGKLILEHDGVEITGQKKLVDFNSKLDKTGGEIDGDLEVTGELTTLTGITILDESSITFKDTKDTTDLSHINTIYKDNNSNLLSVGGPLQVNGKLTTDELESLKDATFDKNVIVKGDLKVNGTTTTVDTETLKVKDNIIVTNSDKKELIDLSGIAINTNATDTYGIMYNPTSKTVNLGLGKIDENGKFEYNENEGSPLAIRDNSDNFTKDHLVSWDADKKELVDGGLDKTNVKNLVDNFKYIPATPAPEASAAYFQVQNRLDVEGIGQLKSSGLTLDQDLNFRQRLNSTTYQQISIIPDRSEGKANSEILSFIGIGSKSQINLNFDAGERSKSNILTDKNASTYLTNYAKLDSINTFTKAQTFNDTISTKSISVKDSSSIEFYPSDYDETVPTRYMQLSGDIDQSTFYFYNADGGVGMTLDIGTDGKIITTENIANNTSNKLDKSTAKKVAYVNDADGNPAMVEYSLLPGNSNIAQFDTGGHLYTEYPSIDTHAANKKYVDDAVSGISLGIDVINIEYNPETLAPVGTYDTSVFETAKKRTTKVYLTATGDSYGILCDKTLENLDETEPNLMFASGLDEAHNYYVIDMDLRDGSLIIQISKEQGQEVLESGINIKTVNGESLLGSGNITIETIKVVEISDVPAEATNGTLTDEQLTTLQSYDGNYIMFNHEKYYLQDKGHVEGYLTYTHTGYENNQMWLKSITVTITTKTWVLNVVGVKPTVVLTQSEYDALTVKDANTLYYIIG